jgi:hypothetical protein
MSPVLRKLILILGALILSGGSKLLMTPGLAAVDPPVALKVIIEIPQRYNWRTGKLLMMPQLTDNPVSPINGPEAHFHVLIENVSSKPVYVFNEDNSQGCGTLSLEVTEADGKKTILQREVVSWTSNVITTQRLAPGESQVREVYYATNAAYLGTMHSPKPWWHSWGTLPFPSGGIATLETVTLRAFFEQGQHDWNAHGRIWLGKVASEPFQVALQSAFPK